MFCRLCTDIKKRKKNSRISNSRISIHVSLLKARTILTGTHFHIILHCFVFESESSIDFESLEILVSPFDSLLSIES